MAGDRPNLLRRLRSRSQNGVFTMPTNIIGLSEVSFANIFHPLVVADRRALDRIEIVNGYQHYANKLPMLRDAMHKPLELRQKIARGSILRLALRDNGLLHAIQVVSAAFDDPFAGIAPGKAISLIAA